MDAPTLGIKAILTENKLGAYADAIVDDQGYDCIEAFESIDPEDLKELMEAVAMKPGHRSIMKRMLKKMAENSSGSGGASSDSSAKGRNAVPGIQKLEDTRHATFAASLGTAVQKEPTAYHVGLKVGDWEELKSEVKFSINTCDEDLSSAAFNDYGLPAETKSIAEMRFAIADHVEEYELGELSGSLKLVLSSLLESGSSLRKDLEENFGLLVHSIQMRHIASDDDGRYYRVVFPFSKDEFDLSGDMKEFIKGESLWSEAEFRNLRDMLMRPPHGTHFEVNLGTTADLTSTDWRVGDVCEGQVAATLAWDPAWVHAIGFAICAVKSRAEGGSCNFSAILAALSSLNSLRGGKLEVQVASPVELLRDYLPSACSAEELAPLLQELQTRLFGHSLKNAMHAFLANLHAQGLKSNGPAMRIHEEFRSKFVGLTNVSIRSHRWKAELSVEGGAATSLFPELWTPLQMESGQKRDDIEDVIWPEDGLGERGAAQARQKGLEVVTQLGQGAITLRSQISWDPEIWLAFISELHTKMMDVCDVQPESELMARSVAQGALLSFSAKLTINFGGPGDWLQLLTADAMTDILTALSNSGDAVTVDHARAKMLTGDGSLLGMLAAVVLPFKLSLKPAICADERR
jgi:hypothetical protein